MFSIAVSFCSEQTSLFRCTSSFFGESHTEHPPTSRIGSYNYLRKRIRFLDYCQYRSNHLPIGSGVTEAACKTVFTQRLKQSGMTWKVDGGQRIVDLRVIQLSGVWSEVYQAYLQAKMLPDVGTQGGSGKKKPQKAA